MHKELARPTVIMESRTPLPNQAVTRQTYLPAKLETYNVQTYLIDPLDLDIYDTSGYIQTYTKYGEEQPTTGMLNPHIYAWRLRDATWKYGDPAAFPSEGGYNSAALRYDFRRRSKVAQVLQELRLSEYSLPYHQDTKELDLAPDDTVLVKPDVVSDITQKFGWRAWPVRADQVNPELIKQFAGGALFQAVEPHILAPDLMHQLEIHDPLAGQSQNYRHYLHCIRIFAPLWSRNTTMPAAELRLTEPQFEMGKRFASKLHLLRPELVQKKLPDLARLHSIVYASLRKRYGHNNFIAVDYLIDQDGGPKIVNALARPLTPSLENQPEDVQHLALAVADVEVAYLASLASGRFEFHKNLRD